MNVWYTHTQGEVYIHPLRIPLWLDEKVMQIVSLAVTNCVILCSIAITTGHHRLLADCSNSLHTTGNVFVVPSRFTVADCHPNSHTNATFVPFFHCCTLPCIQQQTKTTVLIVSTGYFYTKTLMTDPSRVTLLKKVFTTIIANTQWMWLVTVPSPLIQERVWDYQVIVVPIHRDCHLHCTFTSHLQTKPDTTAIL